MSFAFISQLKPVEISTKVTSLDLCVLIAVIQFSDCTLNAILDLNAVCSGISQQLNVQLLEVDSVVSCYALCV